jgi:hypothetical protein
MYGGTGEDGQEELTLAVIKEEYQMVPKMLDVWQSRNVDLRCLSFRPASLLSLIQFFRLQGHS